MTRSHDSEVHPRILVIDDEMATRFALERYLSKDGYAVDSTGEKEEAEALLGHFDYAAVIVDLRLSFLGPTDGLDLVAFARQWCPNAKIVLLTAYASPGVEDEALRRGADFFFEKPLPLPRLTDLLARLLEVSA